MCFPCEDVLKIKFPWSFIQKYFSDRGHKKKKKKRDFCFIRNKLSKTFMKKKISKISEKMEKSENQEKSPKISKYKKKKKNLK